MTLNLDSKFSYKCTQCSQCCVGKKIQINPYEKLRLARNLGVEFAEFCENYTDNSNYLKQTEDLKCVFLKENGCSVHLDRPLVCRLFPLGRHIFEDGSFHFSNPQWKEMPNGKYGENGTIGEFLNTQNANEFIHFADEYFKFYCASSKFDYSKDLQFSTKNIDVLNAEKFTEFYCQKNKIDRPQNPNQYAFYHLTALFALIGIEYKGEML